MRLKNKYIRFLWIVLVISTTFFFIFVILYALDKDDNITRIREPIHKPRNSYRKHRSRKDALPNNLPEFEANFTYKPWNDGGTNTSFSARHLTLLNNDTTVVTAYFRLGKFQKGDTETFTPRLYRTWFTVFSRIENPVIAYFDNDDDAAFFKFIRERITDHPTRVVMVSRDEMWAFNLQPHIERIFAQWWYPKHYPNTVNASYSCAMHAKYELMRRTVTENPYRTLFMAWLDIGLFRQLTRDGDNAAVQRDSRHFRLSPPLGFDSSAVAYGEVFPVSPRLRDPREIIGYNAVWVCGCYFVGRVDKMFYWTAEYMRGVERMLRLNFMSTDQQVLYWMKTNGQIKSRLQTYRENDTTGDYFYLGYRSATVLKSKDEE